MFVFAEKFRKHAKNSLLGHVFVGITAKKPARSKRPNRNTQKKPRATKKTTKKESVNE